MSTAAMHSALTERAVLAREFARLERQLAAAGNTGPYEIPLDDELPHEGASTAGIHTLTRLFGLSRFERDLLLLCAGVEMESALAARCAELSHDPTRPCVTFALAMGALAEPHWSALAPSSPLRRFRLLRVNAADGLTTAPLRIEERVLHYLAGINRLDTSLEGVLTEQRHHGPLAAEHSSHLSSLLEGLETLEEVLLLTGDDPDAQQTIAASVARAFGMSLYGLRLEDAPATAAELDTFLALWRREAALLPAMLLLQCDADAPGPWARRLIDRAPRPIAIACCEPLLLHRHAERLEINKVDPLAQRELWRAELGEESSAIDPLLTRVAGQFRMSAGTIAMLSESCSAQMALHPGHAPQRLWAACRGVARPQLDLLAERIEPRARWADLILPPLQTAALRSMAAQARHRMTVHEEWGFAARGRRGLGLSALFAGPSGTGKTLAAEVLAAELDLDLYRIDLSAVVSKYIGETEKNLRHVFDAAETGGALLLFDEADALFGKRSEVKDSHDRYANIEVGYLLQRMESYQGLAVLTTNLRSALDKSFQRRIRFVVEFPFPDAAQRAAIWAQVFPGATPTHGLDAHKLATLNMPGGNIRNIALNAAFLAAAEASPVSMQHVLAAARAESAKADRPLLDSEIRGWI